MHKYEVPISGFLYFETETENGDKALKLAQQWAFSVTQSIRGDEPTIDAPEPINIALQVDHNHVMHVSRYIEEKIEKANEYERKRYWPALPKKLRDALLSKFNAANEED